MNALATPTRRGCGNLPIIANRFDRTAAECFFTCGAFCFVFRLFADVRVPVLEITREVIRRRIATDVAVDAGRIDVERAGSVFVYAFVWVRHRLIFDFGLVICDWSSRAMTVLTKLSNQQSKIENHQGCVISSGFTRASNSSPVSNPNSIADSRSEIPF
jgi:hypothetical protein